MNFQDAINIMLPPQNGYVPGVNGGYGGNHKGVDFNYHNPDGSKVGQDGVNMEHPPIGSPVKGIVTGIDLKNGMVEITDGFGTRHQIWHLDQINNNLKIGVEIGAGQNIGAMRGRGDADKDGIYGADEYDQHIHYETRTPNGTSMDPEKFWDNGWVDTGSCYDETPFSFLDRLYDLLYGIPDSFSRYFTRGQQWRASADPLTLDLDGDGIETVGINTNNPILFDHDADGVKTATGWIKGDDGLLVLDRNNNGTIDNGRELFGDSTQLSSGGNAADGFAALADLNSNGDGVIDGADAQFANLRVWRDLNQDGISQANELSTLEQQNIASISLTTTQNNQLLPDGNRIVASFQLSAK